MFLLCIRITHCMRIFFKSCWIKFSKLSYVKTFLTFIPPFSSHIIYTWGLLYVTTLFDCMRFPFARGDINPYIERRNARKRERREQQNIPTTSSSRYESRECQQTSAGASGVENCRRRHHRCHPPVALTRNSFNWTLTRLATLKIHETNFYQEHAGFERVRRFDRNLKRREGKRKREKDGERCWNKNKKNLAGTGTKSNVNPVHRLPPK